jgi:teichuronic acid exporter
MSNISASVLSARPRTWHRDTRPAAFSGLIGSLGVMGASEMCNRLTRVATAVTLAHVLSPTEFGLAAVTLTTWELTRVLTSTGLDARIIQCKAEDLEKVCRSSYSLNWWLHLAVCLVQVVMAFPIAHYYGNIRIAFLLLGLALPYLAFPWAAVQVCRLQREQRISITGGMLVLLISGDNLLSVLLALCGFGLWAVVMPKAVMSIVWAVIYRRLSPWRPTGRRDPRVVRDTFRFGAVILATELINVLRLQGDKLIVGQMLGLEQLGSYFFAYNSGLGIMTGIVGALSVALLPHFCKHTEGSWSQWRFWRPALTVSLLILPLVALQVALAPVYVPIVFGARWIHAVPLLMVLCASGVSLGLWRTLTQYIRSQGQPMLELLVTAGYCCSGLSVVLLLSRSGTMAVGYGLLVSSLVMVPALAIISLRHLKSRIEARS